MKKFLKYFLLVVVSLALCLGVYITYELKFKKYDVEDAEVEELINETYAIDLPDGKQMIVDGHGNVLEEIDTTVSRELYYIEEEDLFVSIEDDYVSGVYDAQKKPINHEKIKPGQQVVVENNVIVGIKDNDGDDIISVQPPAVSPETPKVPTETPTVASIKAKYEGSFSSFETQAQSKINGLVNQAKAEYNAKKKNGESVSYGYFYKKYMGAANALEGNTDGSFEALMKVVEKELEQNNFNKSYAESYRTQYEASKKAIRTQMLEKAMSLK